MSHTVDPETGFRAINDRMELTVPMTWLPAARPAATHTDEALMLRYRDGDDGAFRALYARYRAPLMRFARHLAGSASDAEEVFQETWIAVVNGRMRYSVRARFATWLFAIAHRRAADRHRKRARHPTQQIDTEFESATPQPPEVAVADARQLALQTAIAALPFAQREVFLLRAETGLGVREIARITCARPETTKSRLRYALRELRKAMSSWA